MFTDLRFKEGQAVSQQGGGGTIAAPIDTSKKRRFFATMKRSAQY
jgi:hypothetical protein